METTLTNTIIIETQNTPKKNGNYLKKSDSKEFLIGVFYIIRKIFLLG